MFNNTAEPVIKGTEGLWLTAGDGTQLDEARQALRRTVPKNGTNMHAAFQVIRDMNPRPDNVIIAGGFGMPTMDAPTSSKSVVGGGERLNLFSSAVERIPSGVPINIMLYPDEW